MGHRLCRSEALPLCDWLLWGKQPPLSASTTVEMTPWESRALQTEALRANLCTRSSFVGSRSSRTQNRLIYFPPSRLSDGPSESAMKRNHDFSSSDSELDETIEVEKESADENG